jgi:hypothetical protein
MTRPTSLSPLLDQGDKLVAHLVRRGASWATSLLPSSDQGDKLVGLVTSGFV